LAARRKTMRFLGALVCAYLVVLQAALGGLASADHVAASASDPFGVLCLTNDAGSANDPDDRGAKRLGCCTLGCMTAVVAPASEPEPRPFAYDPRPTPRRAAGESETARPLDAAVALKRPRGPPASA
jgi:hypothetical protein